MATEKQLSLINNDKFLFCRKPFRFKITGGSSNKANHLTKQYDQLMQGMKWFVSGELLTETGIGCHPQFHSTPSKVILNWDTQDTWILKSQAHRHANVYDIDKNRN